MKRLIIFTVCLLLTSIGVYADTLPKCFLQHENTITTFNNDISKAIEAAVKGDTIYLTEGTFPKFTLNKEVTIRGAGQGTKIDGGIFISLPTRDKINQTLLEALYIKGSVTLDSSMDGVKLKQCYIYDSFDVSGNNNNIELDRCNIRNQLYQKLCISGLKVTNSYIGALCNKGAIVLDTSVYNFINCTIGTYNYSYVSVESSCIGNFINCILMNAYSGTGSKTINYSELVNCLICWNYTTANSKLQNCYKHTDGITETEEWLKDNNFLGDEGSVVGRYGGENPFTLDPSLPKVADSKITVDPEKKVLNVPLKVSAK